MKMRKKYSAEFRVQAVRALKERVAAGDSLKRVGEDLELDPDLLSEWAREVDQAPSGTPAGDIFPGRGRKRSYVRQEIKTQELIGLETQDQELKRLRREVERLRQERDFLKKAAAFFAKESQ
jgi:transposase